MRRISILIVTLVLVLGSLSIGVAKWFDTITVEGTVTTGNIDLVVTGHSGTWVYNVYDLNNSGIVQTENTYFTGPDTVITHDENFLTTGQGVGLDISSGFDKDGVPDDSGKDGFLVAEAYAMSGAKTDEVNVVFTNIFPLGSTQIPYPFAADIELHYIGSIPATISTVTLEGIDNFGQQLVNDGYITTAKIGTSGTDIEGATGRIKGRNVIDGFQLHSGDTFNASINITIPQEGPYIGRSGSFKAVFTVSQYNQMS